MSFVKTEAEIASIHGALADLHLPSSRLLSVTCDCDQEWLSATLPPPLHSTEDAVRIAVGSWKGGCAGDHSGAGVYIPARYGDTEGEYVLMMYMDRDTSIILGREFPGEPKKLALVALDIADDWAKAVVERQGTTLIRLSARLTDERPAGTTRRTNFNYRVQFRADGRGLADDAWLTATTWEVNYGRVRAGTGTVRLQGTAHDPLHRIPLGAVREAVWSVGSMRGECKAIARVGRADFEPYAYSRLDDYRVLR